jgi:hypothetical protein
MTYEANRMKDKGKITLYLAQTGEIDRSAMGLDKPMNWDNTFSIKTFGTPRKFRHPFSRMATIVYFPGPDGHVWSARNIGDNDIAHCRRLKEKWRNDKLTN